jgi:molybdopterin synthase catalytic subunit
MMIRVQTETFDPAEAFSIQKGRADAGGLACFVGYVREFTSGGGQTLELQHYPGFTENAIQDIVGQARARFDILDQLVIHRFGVLEPMEPIVLVSVISKHRDAAFDAARFIMDALKTGAPFWKKEHSPDGVRWIEPRPEDYAARTRWTQSAQKTEDEKA